MALTREEKEYVIETLDNMDRQKIEFCPLPNLSLIS